MSVPTSDANRRNLEGNGPTETNRLNFTRFFNSFRLSSTQTIIKETITLQGDLHQQIKAWLTQHKQRIVLTSNFVSVNSGIPQGTVTWTINVSTLHQ